MSATVTFLLALDISVAIYLRFRLDGSSPSRSAAATTSVTGGSATINGPLVSSVPAPPAAAPAVVPPTIQAAWAQVVPKDPQCEERTCEVRMLVRVVVPIGASCAGLARAAKNNQAVGLKRRENRVPDRFPIDVCEALLTLDQDGVNLVGGSAIRWTGLATEPRTISIIGDTGCQEEEMQNCNALPAWPLANVATEAAWLKHATAAASSQPDLVIHVGDYRYRGDDDWAQWNADFFTPMRPLLLAAPWVMVRGNHENCFGDHGVGWALLLSSGFGHVPDCNESVRYNRASIEPAAAIDLNGLRLVTLDAADAKYRCRSWRDTFEVQELTKLKAVLQRPPGDDRALWLLTHYPVLSVYGSDECPIGARKASVAAYQEMLVPVVQAGQVDAILAGDLHSLQLLHSKLGASGTGRIVQLVAGNGGTKLDDQSYALTQLRKFDPPCTDTATNPHYISCSDLGLGARQGYPDALGLKVTAYIRFEFGMTTAIKLPGPNKWQFRSQTLPLGDNELGCEIPAQEGQPCGPASTRR